MVADRLLHFFGRPLRFFEYCLKQIHIIDPSVVNLDHLEYYKTASSNFMTGGGGQLAKVL
jgi:hypothetical protein